MIDALDHLTAESGVTESIGCDCTAKAGSQLQTTTGKAKPLCSKLGDAHPSVLLSNPKKRICDNTGESVGCINTKFHAWMTTADNADLVVHKPPTHWASKQDVQRPKDALVDQGANGFAGGSDCHSSANQPVADKFTSLVLTTIKSVMF